MKWDISPVDPVENEEKKIKKKSKKASENLLEVSSDQTAMVVDAGGMFSHFSRLCHSYKTNT
jgi:hypothetical protein